MNKKLFLPRVPRVDSTDLRAFLSGVRSRLSALIGESGNKGSKAVTLQDLVDMNIITQAQAEKQAGAR